MKNRKWVTSSPKDRGAVARGRMNDRRSIFRRENNTRRARARDTDVTVLTDRLLRPTPQFPSTDMSIISRGKWFYDPTLEKRSRKEGRGLCL